MIIKLIELNGSVKASFPLADIKHVETRTLEYFGEKTHNLYLYIGEGKGEYFMLLNYLCPINMKRAADKLQDLIQQASLTNAPIEEAVFELHPDATPVLDLAAGIPHSLT
ncbi:hypothetical protein I0P70_10595 [Pontibacter sp. FD36]|uniref:hypothetical protein n=1 Tax=Pontibacter sp. FD36 TaxID=2789860 RepID=UPI0018A8CFEE|nr:hypothetical protein [Pontibacter sp. FD36]MBF8963697.1 hypothetical protein [Pontibacter sp. FD36]